MRANTIVHLQELLEEPEEKKQRPALRMIGLSAGQRRVFRELTRDHQRRLQKLRDDNPAAAERQLEMERLAAEAEIERLKEAAAKKEEPEQDAENGAGEASSEDAPDDSEGRDGAGLREKDWEMLKEQLLKNKDTIYAFGAFRVEVEIAGHDLAMRQLAVVTRGVLGDWSLVDPDLPASPEWPSVDPRDPGPAIEARVSVLEMLAEADINRALAAMDTFLASGGAGLTEEQRGN